MSLDPGFTCHAWMPLLTPHLPEHLVDPEARERLARLTELLPGTVLGAIEIRLAPGPGPVDLAVRLSMPGEACQIAQWIQPPHVREYLLGWARAPEPLLPYTWLEFDLPDAGGDLAPVLISRIKRRTDPDWLLDVLLPALRGRPPHPAQRAMLLRTLTGLPEESWCCYAFDMQSRGTDAVRLSFSGLRPHLMPDRLEHLGRPDLAEALRPAVGLVKDRGLFELNLEVDRDAEIRPRVGFEMSFKQWPGNDPQWQSLLGRLVDAGLCSSEKRDAALAWSGYDSPRRAPGAWPARKELARTYLVRWISHVKLVCVPGEPLEAKAYLLFALWTRSPNGRLKEGAGGLPSSVESSEGGA